MQHVIKLSLLLVVLMNVKSMAGGISGAGELRLRALIECSKMTPVSASAVKYGKLQIAIEADFDSYSSENPSPTVVLFDTSSQISRFLVAQGEVRGPHWPQLTITRYREGSDNNEVLGKLSFHQSEGTVASHLELFGDRNDRRDPVRFVFTDCTRVGQSK